MKLIKLMLCVTSMACLDMAKAESQKIGDYTWTYSDGEITSISPSPTGFITIPSSLGGRAVTSIARGAFPSANNMTGVSMPNTLYSIGIQAFAFSYKLKDVQIPSGVVRIGWGAFEHCTSLTNVTIPASVITMGTHIDGYLDYEGYGMVFEYCTNLVSVQISDMKAWCGIEFYSKNANPLYYARNLYLNGNLVTDLKIPDGTKNIGNAAFLNCDCLKSVTIPNSVMDIGQDAFLSCDSLTNVTIGSSVKNLGRSAFSGCSGLTSVLIGNSVTNIGYYAFCGCSGLTGLTIPNSVTNIRSSAFLNCSGLTSVTIPDSVTNIEWCAFAGCSNLLEVFLPTTYAGETADRFTKYYGGERPYGPVPIVRYKPIQTVSFDAAGGTMSSASKMVRFDSPYGALPVPVREGYGFVRWRLDGAPVSADTVVRALDDHALIADWTGNGYTLSFDANGGTGEMDNVLLAYGVEESLPQNTFHRRNYVFAGWATNATDEAVSYGDGVTVSNMTAEANATLTLYAVWAPLVVATPEFTPESGTTFGADTCTISLSCATEGSAIYYSTNGVTPRMSAANLYSEPFKVSGDVTVIAVAKFEDVRSDYMTATFTKGAPAVPVIEPCDGTMFVDDSCEVSISCDTEGVAIYYSTNGTMPQKTAEYRYTGPFSISATTTIKAFSANDTFDSECASATIIKWDMTLAEAVGAPSLGFTTGGDAVWTAIADNTAASGYSAKSGEIGDAVPGGSNITWLATTVTGAGALGFDWKVACEHDDMGGCTWDRLIVFTNDVEAARIDGVSGWERKSLVFEEGGTHTVLWMFLKDDTNDEMFEDCAWVSGVTWTPSGHADVVVNIDGKEVTVPGTWLSENTTRAATDTAANGRKVWECYLLGIDPERADDDFKITRFWMDGDKPMFEFSHTRDGSGVSFEPRIRRMGKAALGDAWQEVPAGGNPAFRFFTVEVEPPR